MPCSALSRAWNKIGLGKSSLPEETPEAVDVSEECGQLGIESSEGEQWLDADVNMSGVDELNDEQIINMARSQRFALGGSDFKTQKATPIFVSSLILKDKCSKAYNFLFYFKTIIH